MVTLATESMMIISDYFGIGSGNEMSKIEKTGCRVRKDVHVNTSVIEEHSITLEYLRV